MKSPGKVLFTIAGLQPEYGGPATSVPALAEALARAGVPVDLVTCESSPGQAPPRLPPSALVTTRLVPPANRKTRWRSADNAFAQCLSAPPQGAAYSVVHDHGLWLPNNHAVAAAACQRGIPRLVSPRGMLSRWSLSHKGWKKRMAWWLYQRRDLTSANVLHATSKAEAQEFRAVGLRQPIAVIPNGVEIPALVTIDHRPRTTGLRTLLFLGRIHPIKALLDLVAAWAVISEQRSVVSGQPRERLPQWRVVVAGADDGGHVENLKADIKKLQLEASFEFAGPVKGEAKWELYRRADLFVLPSHSENFGIVIAEALVCGVPVITTRGTPWEDLVTHRCGWWTEMGSEPLAVALREAMALGDDVRHEMGLRGRRLVEEKFSWPGIATQMLTVYRWMIGEGTKPPCMIELGGAT